MRNIFALVLCALPFLTYAQNWEDRQMFNGNGNAPTLSILSSTDTSFFAPIIKLFLNENPSLSIEYLVTTTSEIDRVFRQDPSRYDIVISSAMDLQLKLVNDGYALELSDIEHPDWAQWRHRLFAFTTEPATIVVNSAAFEGIPIPKTRQELIHTLRRHPDLFRGKLGTYECANLVSAICLPRKTPEPQKPFGG